MAFLTCLARLMHGQADAHQSRWAGWRWVRLAPSLRASRLRRRVLSGSASLRSLSRRRYRAPFPPADARDGDGQAARQHPCWHDRLPIRRLVVGRCAPAAVCSGSVSPHDSVGGETGRIAEAEAASPRLRFIPLRPRWGYGEKRKEGYRGMLRLAPLIGSEKHRAAMPAHPPALRRFLVAGRICRAATI